MRIPAKTAEQRASAAAMKERRAQDAAQAMREYEAKRVATLAKTARLRALRLAKEAEAGNLAPKKTRSPKNAV
jgi:aspartate/methionine/tyrosine aminotransferase